MPLSGLQTALKRRNSKTYDFSRRGSLSVYSTYSLPSSKTSMRRFSSYEELAPIFNLLAPPPEKSVVKRISSFRRRSRRKSSTCSESSDDCESKSCEDLDAQIAKIKQQLAELKNEDIELTQRVDDLHSSVSDICKSCHIEPVPVSTQNEGEERRRWSSNSLSVIRESSVEILDEDLEKDGDQSDSEEQSFEEYCKANFPIIGTRSRPRSLPSIEIQSVSPVDPKKHCLPNNTLKTKVRSSPQLHIIRNDLSDSAPEPTSSFRLSVISVWIKNEEEKSGWRKRKIRTESWDSSSWWPTNWLLKLYFKLFISPTVITCYIACSVYTMYVSLLICFKLYCGSSITWQWLSSYKLKWLVYILWLSFIHKAEIWIIMYHFHLFGNYVFFTASTFLYTIHNNNYYDWFFLLLFNSFISDSVYLLNINYYNPPLIQTKLISENNGIAVWKSMVLWERLSWWEMNV